MCRLFVIRGPVANKIAIELAKRSFEAFNRDGYGFWTPNKVYRTMVYSDYIKELEYLDGDVDFIAGHLRLATSPPYTEEGIHFWEIAGYYFAHNGIVSGYDYLGYMYGTSIELDTFPVEEMVDSHQFFSRIMDEYPITVKHIREIISESGYSGTSFLTGEDFSKYWIISTRNFYIVEYKIDGKKGYIISSMGDIVNTPITLRSKVRILKNQGVFKYEKTLKKEKKLPWVVKRVPAGIYKISVGKIPMDDKSVGYKVVKQHVA